MMGETYELYLTDEERDKLEEDIRTGKYDDTLCEIKNRVCGMEEDIENGCYTWDNVHTISMHLTWLFGTPARHIKDVKDTELSMKIKAYAESKFGEYILRYSWDDGLPTEIAILIGRYAEDLGARHQMDTAKIVRKKGTKTIAYEITRARWYLNGKPLGLEGYSEYPI